MRKSLPPERRVEPGRIYRDLDGEVVWLVKVKGNLCTWAPAGEGESSREVTHRDNFARRFTPVDLTKGRKAA